MAAPFGRLLDFRGRSTRAEHWPFMGLLIGAFVAGTTLAMLTAQSVRSALSIVQLLLVIVALLASASIVRRMHDAGWSGRWMVIFLLLLAINSMFFLYWRYGREHPIGADWMNSIWPVAMVASYAMWGIALLVLLVTTFDGADARNRFGPPTP